MKKHTHIGVYAIIRKANKILCIKKARGPYTGKFDLPGGGIEFGEIPLEAIEREVLEETGLTVKKVKLVDVLSHQEKYITSSGNLEHLHHLGMIYQVKIESYRNLKIDQDGEDSLGALWVPVESIFNQNSSPFCFQSKKYLK